MAPITIDRWFGPGFDRRRPDLLNRATMALLRQEASTHGTIWNMVADLDLADEIRGISCPALIAGGDADVNTPTPVIKALSRALDDAPVEMIEGVGHFPLIEAPELFNAILGRFLEGLFTGAGAG